MQSSRIRYLEIVADENRIVYHQPSSPFVAFLQAFSGAQKGGYKKKRGRE
jgi:hypothetical protein